LREDGIEHAFSFVGFGRAPARVRGSSEMRKENDMSLKDLRKSPMMAHLLDAIEQGKDIGHYGRLTVAMVAHHYVEPDELARLLMKGGGTDEREAKALVQQVTSRDYNPPSRPRILEWQAQQDFPICPTPDDPGACNVYRDLDLPEAVIEHIEDFREQQFNAESTR
jgi:hypothetical protein